MKASLIYLTLALAVTMALCWYFFNRDQARPIQHSHSHPKAPPAAAPESFSVQQDSPPPIKVEAPSGLSQEEQQGARLIVELFQSGQYQKAWQLLKDYRSKPTRTRQFVAWAHEREAVIITSLAWQLIQGGQCQEAISYLEQSLKIKDLPETNKGLGLCHYRLKNLATAEEYILKFLASDKSDANVDIIYADILESQSRFEEATEILDKLNRDQSQTGNPSDQIKDRLDSMRAKLGESYHQGSLSSSHFVISYRIPDHEDLVTVASETLESALIEFTESWAMVFPEQPFEVLLYPANKFGHLVSYGPKWASGLYDGRIRVQVRPEYITNSTDGVFAGLLRHELSHALLSEQIQKRELPYWFNEGLAMYLECKGGCQPTDKSRQSLAGKFVERNQFEQRFISLDKNAAIQVYTQSLHIIQTLAQATVESDQHPLRLIISSLNGQSGLGSDDLLKPVGLSFVDLYTKAAKTWNQQH